MTEAFPWDEAPGHLIRARDGAFGAPYIRRVREMGIATTQSRRARPDRTDASSESSARSGANAWEVSGEGHLRRILKTYTAYYKEVRTHLSLGKDAPKSRRS